MKRAFCCPCTGTWSGSGPLRNAPPSSGEAVVVRTDAMYDELKAAPTAPGFREIMIPGEIEFHLTRQAEREGIDISPAIEQDFADLAVRYGVPLELLQSC